MEFRIPQRVSHECKLNSSCVCPGVKRGLNCALKEHGPVLIVAHGGVYWAICYLMNITGEWTIDHCIPVHFTVYKNEKWSAKKLINPSQEINNA